MQSARTGSGAHPAAHLVGSFGPLPVDAWLKVTGHFLIAGLLSLSLHGGLPILHIRLFFDVHI